MMDFETMQALLEENRLLRERVNHEEDEMEKNIEAIKEHLKDFFELSRIFQNKSNIVEQYSSIFDYISQVDLEVKEEARDVDLSKCKDFDLEVSLIREKIANAKLTKQKLTTEKAELMIKQQKALNESIENNKSCSALRTELDHVIMEREAMLSEQKELESLVDYWSSKTPTEVPAKPVEDRKGVYEDLSKMLETLDEITSKL